MSHVRPTMLLIASLFAMQARAEKQTLMSLPPPPSAPVVFYEGTDTYGCGQGEPVHLASELIQFDKQHDYKGGVIEYQAYKFSKMLTDWIVDVPPPLPAGVVTVHVAVPANGPVMDFILECSTDTALNDAIAAAVKRAKFKPASLKGVAVNSVATVAFHTRRN